MPIRNRSDNQAEKACPRVLYYHPDDQALERKFKFILCHRLIMGKQHHRDTEQSTHQAKATEGSVLAQGRQEIP